jgi:hypothetical protein
MINSEIRPVAFPELLIRTPLKPTNPSAPQRAGGDPSAAGL